MSEPADQRADPAAALPGRQPSPLRSAPVRVALAAATGAGLVLAWSAVFQLTGLPFFVDGADFRCEGIGCAAAPFGALFVNLMLTVSLVFGVSVAISWLVLRLARVDQAWPVVLLGPVATLFVVWLGDRVLAEATVAATVMVALGYALAAYLTAPTLRRSTRIASVAVVLGVAVLRALTE
ncbi:hypothetical protein [Amycolatopsis aidingensis]|uniref:hypothetical protein n=1 Tax=Amycolatopsis aidingensis TaxID=2842453 RepID=UPI001C0B8E64|nr:hypothetical protein [Amycolatopsis aidingensis]